MRLGHNKADRDRNVDGLVVSKWTARFTWTAIIQGGIVAILTAMLAAITATTASPKGLVQMMLVNPAIGFSEVSALPGLGLYLVVGVIGTGLTAQFYHHFEVRHSKPYRDRIANGLAWIHLVALNVGVAAASLMMIYAGFLGDIAVSPTPAGGYGMTPDQAAVKVLNPFIIPVSAMLLVMVAGAIAGGTGFLLNRFGN